MDLDRKEFIKLTALSVAAGVAGPAALTVMAEHGQSEPVPGQKKLGFVIDMSKCKEGCTDCIDSCHKIHNVPSIPNKKHEIKWIWKEKYHNLFPDDITPYMSEEKHEQQFLTLCNHCEHPPCVRVCPTQATFKRQSDGIVMMDFHRCIGCRFCMAGCPYGSRSFNYSDPRNFLKAEDLDPGYPTRTKGVVEKCDMCYERLEKGETIACAEACKEGAIVFGDLNDPNSEIREVIRKNNTLRRKPELGTNPNAYYVM